MYSHHSLSPIPPNNITDSLYFGHLWHKNQLKLKPGPYYGQDNPPRDDLVVVYINKPTKDNFEHLTYGYIDTFNEVERIFKKEGFDCSPNHSIWAKLVDESYVDKLIKFTPPIKEACHIL